MQTAGTVMMRARVTRVVMARWRARIKQYVLGSLILELNGVECSDSI